MNISCCSGFQDLLNNAGHRGISALVWRSSKGIAFLLQSRGIAFEDELKLKPMPLDLKINISSELGVQYCPFCGKRLRDLVESSASEYETLADDHKKFHNLPL